jgi:hypothetical protein
MMMAFIIGGRGKMTGLIGIKKNSSFMLFSV